MSQPIVTLATSAQFPNLDTDDQGLPDALRERGIEPRIAIWDDPSVDWEEAGIVVVRSVRDYAKDRDKFVSWARSVPRILNSAETMAWNTDKHYLQDLERLGLPTIPTIWLEPEQNLSKRLVNSRFPALGDFVVKPAVSSGGRGTGRYKGVNAESRGEAIAHAMYELGRGRSVMVQRYLKEIDVEGETSLIYFNGLASHQVVKAPMLHPRFSSVKEQQVVEESVRSTGASIEMWTWGEKIRGALQAYIKEKVGHNELLLFNRVDIVRGDKDSPEDFYVMEVSLIDGSLYLQADEKNLGRFADAIAARVFW